MNKASNVKFKNRPTCSCGTKMKLIKYTGYYDTFNYWRCDNCELDKEIQNAKTDKVEKGGFAL